MQLPKTTFDEEPPLKIPSSRKSLRGADNNLDSSSSLIFDHERKPDEPPVIVLPEPPKFSRYA